MEPRTTILALALLLPGCESTSEPDAPPPLELAQPDRVTAAAAWELRIWYRSRGTRSEGQHGVLLRDGVEVVAARVGELRETSLGELRYYGTPGDGMPWQPSGWNFADPTRIVPSWAADGSR